MTSDSASAGLPPTPRSGRAPIALALRVFVVFVTALGVLEWLVTLSVPGAAAGFGSLALALCLISRVADEPTAAILPVLVALPVVRLATVALLPPGGASPTRLGVVAVPAMVTVAAAVRAYRRSRRRPRPIVRNWSKARSDTALRSM
jgi:hypothetical protein